MTTLLLALLLAKPAVLCPHPHRSPAVVRAFKRAHPCPGGVDRGSKRRCRGYVVDHVCPLAACCGLDAPQNMQWQTVAEAKRKDRWEATCSLACR